VWVPNTRKGKAGPWGKPAYSARNVRENHVELSKTEMLNTLLILVLVLSVGAQDKREIGATRDWKGIVPLQSTRSDVERVFGNPLDRDCYDCTYETETEKV
jgi:hypothetical protein